MASQPKSVSRFLLWMLAGVVAILLSFSLDNRVDTALDVIGNSSLSRIAWWCSKLGQGWVPALVGIVLVIFFVLRQRQDVAAKIFFAVTTCELTGGAGLILRILIGRTRPNADAPQGFYGVWHNGHWIINQPDFSSFPSGHAATVVGLAAAAWLVNRKWGMAIAVYALAVIWSRIALQAHHLSDIVASIVLAIPLAMLLKKILLPWVEFQFSNLNRTGRKNASTPVVSQKIN